MIALTLSLMRWQLGRAEEKAALAAILAARVSLEPIRLTGDETDGESIRYRRALATGEWRPDRAIFVDNRSHKEKIGYHVLVPLQLAGGAEVIVNIGFAQRPRDYPKLPVVDLPRGVETVEGTALVPSTRYVELASNTIVGPVWQNFDLARYQRVTGRKAAPVVLSPRTARVGLEPVVEVPDTGIDKHRGYAFQWGAMATAIFIIWILTNVQLTARHKPTAP